MPDDIPSRKLNALLLCGFHGSYQTKRWRRKDLSSYGKCGDRNRVLDSGVVFGVGGEMQDDILDHGRAFPKAGGITPLVY